MTDTTPTPQEQYAAAYVAAWAELQNVVAASSGQARQAKYKYAKLDAVLDAVRPTLAKHGLAVQQPQVEPPTRDSVAVATILMHRSGHSERWVTVMPSPTDPQGVGSALTYLRRYSLSSALSISTQDDDDATSAQPRQQQKRQSAPTVNLVSPEKRAALKARIDELGDPYTKQIGDRLRAGNVKWNQLTKPQHDDVSSWVDECAELKKGDA